MKEKIKHRTALNENGCWIFLGCLNSDGYGNIRVGDHTYGAHRVSYEAFKGPIPKGVSVLHTCDTPACVNPEHLFLGTQQDNVTDMITKGRQNFRSNVKLTEDNVQEIRRLLKEGKYSMKAIGRMFGVDSPAIWFIKHKQTWGWLPEEEVSK